MTLLCIKERNLNKLFNYGFKYNPVSAKGPCYHRKGINVVWYSTGEFSSYIVQIYGNELGLVVSDVLDIVRILLKKRIFYWKVLK